MIAFYLRLSMSDGDLGIDRKDESNSIENQRLLLQQYLEDKDDLIGDVIEYVDDGYTGTNFDRPGFKRMLEDCRSGKVTTIIVKDLSRFGRNYIEVGDYIEQLFPLLGIRFIAVNHSYDSKDFSGEPMGFDMEINNLISSLYSRDLSKKRKSTNHVLWKNGKSTAGSCPYGYIKDPNNKGKWLVDVEAAKVVKLIFERASKGMRCKSIAAYLNERKIPTPTLYNDQHMIKSYLNVVKVQESENLWNPAKVRMILKRYEYTGALVAGRQSPVTVGSSSVRNNDESEWIITENVNEPIVSKKMFELANIVNPDGSRKEYKRSRKYPLKGKIRCGNCGLAMTYAPSTIDSSYICKHGVDIGKYSKCCKKKSSVKSVDGRVFYALRNMLKLLLEAGSLIINQHKKEVKEFRDTDIDSIEQEIKMLKAQKIREYELYAEGHMSKDLYLFKKKQVTQKIENMISQKEEMEAAMVQSVEGIEEIIELTDKAGTFLEESKLNSEMVDAFIEVVYVYSPEKIKIVFKYEDRIKEILEEAEEYKAEQKGISL